MMNVQVLEYDKKGKVYVVRDVVTDVLGKLPVFPELSGVACSVCKRRVEVESGDFWDECGRWGDKYSVTEKRELCHCHVLKKVDGVSGEVELLRLPKEENIFFKGVAVFDSVK